MAVHEFDPVSALSLEMINILWSGSLAGTFIDPTGGTTGQPLMTPSAAFPVSSGDFRNPAQPVTWYTGTWLAGGNRLGVGYVAQVGVGPGGSVTLSAGVSYDVWGKLASGGGAEAPVKFVGTLRAY